MSPRFPLSWSHYVRLMMVEDAAARRFYESEALRGGWTVRQLYRQIGTPFYERTALSRDKASMLLNGAALEPAARSTMEEAVKDLYVLEFLDLRDEYSESDLEDALIRRLEEFLLELGSEFAFIGRQRRLRVGSVWYRVDLVLFHRRLRCLVMIDLKLGERNRITWIRIQTSDETSHIRLFPAFCSLGSQTNVPQSMRHWLTHADAGHMHLYCNYAREHWTLEGENPPVGLILCAQKGAAVAHYALDGLSNKVLAAEYRTALPDEQTLAVEIERTRKLIAEHTYSRLHRRKVTGGGIAAAIAVACRRGTHRAIRCMALICKGSILLSFG